MSTRTIAPRRHVRFLQTGGPELHLERYDAGAPAVLLIHGGGDGAFVWDSFAPVLARRLTTLVVDLRGHGDSGWDASGRYEDCDYLSDLTHVVEQSELSNFILIGHSLGARLAIRLRARYPERVLASVLVDFAPELNAEGREHAVSLMRQSLQHYPTIERYAEWLEERRPLARTELLDHIAARALRPDDEGFRPKIDPALPNTFGGLLSRDAQGLWNLLQRQSCPTLVVRGSGSALLSHATASRMAEALPRGELATVDAAGHSVMLDNPEAFEHTVLDFLARVLPPPNG